MKPISHQESSSFKTPLRHYHRIQCETQTWKDWVNGPTPTKAEQSVLTAHRWLRISTTCCGLLVLVGLITSLIVELS